MWEPGLPTCDDHPSYAARVGGLWVTMPLGTIAVVVVGNEVGADADHECGG